MKTILSHIPLLLAIGSFVTTVVADSVTYSVVGLPSSNDNEFGVLIDDIVYKLSPSEEDSTILFQVEAPIADAKYHFVELDKETNDIVHEEGFDRQPIETQINQVYGRSWTTQSVKTFKKIYDQDVYRDLHKTNLHPEDEIPSIHIVADQNEIDRIHDHYNQDITVQANLTLIGAHEIQKFTNVNFQIDGKLCRFKPKPSYAIKLTDGQQLGGYETVTLRAVSSDPTFLRDKVSFDMMIAANLPGSRISYKRVYLNNVAVGLYVFTEKYDEAWFAQNTNPGSPVGYKNGVLYHGAGSTKFPGELSDLRYISDDPTVYADHGYTIEMEDKNQEKGFTVLSDFIKFIDHELKKPMSNSTENENEIVAEWGKYINVEIFLQSMIFEFVTNGWDNYLSWGDNYYLYKCPINHFIVYVGWDFEATFGNSPLPKSVQLEGDYRHIEGFNNRPLAKAVLRVPFFREFFEAALKNIVMSIFNPEISFPVIDSLAEFIREDVEWDRNVLKINSGKDFSILPETDLAAGEPLDFIPVNMPKDTDSTLLKEHMMIVSDKIDFQTSIDGPTGFESLMGLKEFIQEKFDSVHAHI